VIDLIVISDIASTIVKDSISAKKHILIKTPPGSLSVEYSALCLMGLMSTVAPNTPHSTPTPFFAHTVTPLRFVAAYLLPAYFFAYPVKRRLFVVKHLSPVYIFAITFEHHQFIAMYLSPAYFFANFVKYHQFVATPLLPVNFFAI
jgi:hypothetical protein